MSCFHLASTLVQGLFYMIFLMMPRIAQAQVDVSGAELIQRVNEKMKTASADSCYLTPNAADREICKSQVWRRLLLEEVERSAEAHVKRYCALPQTCDRAAPLGVVSENVSKTAQSLCEWNCRNTLPQSMHAHINGCHADRICKNQMISFAAQVKNCGQGTVAGSAAYVGTWKDFWATHFSPEKSGTTPEEREYKILQTFSAVSQCLKPEVALQVYCAAGTHLYAQLAEEWLMGAAVERVLRAALMGVVKGHGQKLMRADGGLKALAKNGVRVLSTSETKLLGSLKWFDQEASSVAFIPGVNDSPTVLIRSKKTGEVMSFSGEAMSPELMREIYKVTAIGFRDGDKMIVTEAREVGEDLYLRVRGRDDTYHTPHYSEAQQKMGIQKISGEGKDEVWEIPHPSSLNRIYNTQIFVTHPERAIDNQEYWRFLANGKVPIPIASVHDLAQHAEGFAVLSRDVPRWTKIQGRLSELFRIHDNQALSKETRSAAIKEIQNISFSLEALSDGLSLNGRTATSSWLDRPKSELDSSLARAEKFIKAHRR